MQRRQALGVAPISAHKHNTDPESNGDEMWNGYLFHNDVCRHVRLNSNLVQLIIATVNQSKEGQHPTTFSARKLTTQDYTAQETASA